jgi:hypothetical protein
MKAGEVEIIAQLLEQGSYASRSTDRHLATVRVQFQTGVPKEKQLLEEFLKSGGVVETDWAKPTVQRWHMGEHTSSYFNNSPETTYTWQLLAHEDIKIDSLKIDGWELTPYRYKEEFDQKNVLTAHARVELTEPDEKRLRALPAYFQVVRKGINEKPREMRFGQILWSQRDEGGSYRMKLILVDKALDEHGAAHGFMEPQISNVVAEAAIVRLRLKALLEKLESKGVLSAEEGTAVRVVSAEGLQEQIRHNDQVDDIDEWLRSEE